MWDSCSEAESTRARPLRFNSQMRDSRSEIEYGQMRSSHFNTETWGPRPSGQEQCWTWKPLPHEFEDSSSDTPKQIWGTTWQGSRMSIQSLPNVVITNSLNVTDALIQGSRWFSTSYQRPHSLVQPRSAALTRREHFFNVECLKWLLIWWGQVPP